MSEGVCYKTAIRNPRQKIVIVTRELASDHEVVKFILYHGFLVASSYRDPEHKLGQI